MERLIRHFRAKEYSDACNTVRQKHFRKEVLSTTLGPSGEGLGGSASAPPSGPEHPAGFGGPLSWLYDLSHHLASKERRAGKVGDQPARQRGVSPAQTQVQLLALGTGEKLFLRLSSPGGKGLLNPEEERMLSHTRLEPLS